jgi:hypothetical protein
MRAATLPQLLADATLVAEAGARLGWLDPGADLLPAIAAARRTASGDDAAALEQRLHQALNVAVKAIAPITLDDLRRGWRPYETTLPRRIGIACFFVFSVALMVFCAYASQVYERARSTYATTLELQDARGAEQAMRLFGMLKRNQQEVEESLSTGKKEFLYEVFGKALFDLKAMQVKNLAYAPIASNTLNDLEMLVDPAVALQRLRDPANPSGLREVQGWLKAAGYGPNPPALAAEGGGAGALPVAAAQAPAPARRHAGEQHLADHHHRRDVGRQPRRTVLQRQVAADEPPPAPAAQHGRQEAAAPTTSRGPLIARASGGHQRTADEHRQRARISGCVGLAAQHHVVQREGEAAQQAQQLGAACAAAASRRPRATARWPRRPAPSHAQRGRGGQALAQQQPRQQHGPQRHQVEQQHHAHHVADGHAPVERGVGGARWPAPAPTAPACGRTSQRRPPQP